MTPDRNPPGAGQAAATAPAKAGWLWPAAWLYLLFPVYGSLIPFAWQEVGLADAVRQFAELLSEPLAVASRADFAANILLAVPLAALWMAAMVGGRGRRSPPVEAAAAAAVWLGCSVLALALEFSQIFFSGRSPALSDVVAQSIGAGFGLAAWCMVPAGFWHVSRSPATAWKQVRSLYLGGLLLYSLMPLDLTVSLSDLSNKVATGMVRVVPFSGWAAQPLQALADAALDTAIWALAAVLLLRAAGRLSAAAAAGLLLFAVGIECAQFLVLSRVVDTTDILTAALGIGFVAAANSRLQGAAPHESEKAGGGAWPRRAALPALLIVAGFVLRAYPFDFIQDTWTLRLRLETVSLMPFASYVSNGELYLVTNLLRRFFLFSAIGAALQWTFSASKLPLRWHTPAVLLACMASALLMEAMQLALPRGYFDSGDVLFAGLCGAVAGAVVRRLSSSGREAGQAAGAVSGPRAGGGRRHRSRRGGTQAGDAATAALDRIPPRRLALFAWAGCVGLPVALALAAYAPGTPYNVRELLTEGGLPWPVLPMTGALLGLLGLPGLIAARAGAPRERRLAGVTTAWLLGAPWLLALLVYAGVDLESVHDVVGTAVWGLWAPGETVLRLAVLLQGVLWSLALGAALSGCAAAPSHRLAGAARLLAHGFWVVPLWHAVVVVFAGTDNLTELMAGGGGAVPSLCLLAYGALLGWAAGEALKAVAGPPAGHWAAFLPRLLLASAAGYGLARAATESTLVKYDQVFSALQFLLSTDRGHYATGANLLMRFLLAQCLALAGLALSMLVVRRLSSKRAARPITAAA